VIESIRIRKTKELPVPWWREVETLKKRRVFKFKPGLNIVWGRNGSGKSTLLRLLARWFHSEAGGRSVVTFDSVRQFKSSLGRGPWLFGADVEHDGQTVLYGSPEKAIGLTCGGAAFDDNFMMQGLSNLTFRGSSGEITKLRIGMVLSQLREHGAEIGDRIGKDTNDLWQEYRRVAQEQLRPTIDKGQVTIILDEPDRSLDIDHAHSLWTEQIPTVVEAGKIQLIVATHSTFALRFEGAHYIELNPGYLEECRKLCPA